MACIMCKNNVLYSIRYDIPCKHEGQATIFRCSRVTALRIKALAKTTSSFTLTVNATTLEFESNAFDSIR